MKNVYCSEKFPRIVHLIYIPWDENQQLKDDPMDFDTSFWKRFVKKLGPTWTVMMWTRPKIEKLMNKYYLKEWEYMKQNSDRPVMLVDYLRLKLLYHFGGIYWQYGSTLKTRIKEFIPRIKGGVQLLTDYRMNIVLRFLSSFRTIRKGKFEEELRIATQVFSAYPKNKFIKHIINQCVKNVGRYEVKSDYDIIFMTGNAMMSTVYDKCYKLGITEKYGVEVCSLKKSRSMVEFLSKGSWRSDNTHKYFYYYILGAVLLIIALLMIFLGYIKI